MWSWINSIYCLTILVTWSTRCPLAVVPANPQPPDTVPGYDEYLDEQCDAAGLIRVYSHPDGASPQQLDPATCAVECESENGCIAFSIHAVAEDCYLYSSCDTKQAAIMDSYTAKYCDIPPTVVNGGSLATSFYFPAVSPYQCLDDYEIMGNTNLTCDITGTWAGTLPECTYIGYEECKQYCSHANDSSILSVYCDNDYVMEVTYANYGQSAGGEECNGDMVRVNATSDCVDEGVNDLVKSVCNGETNCTLNINTVSLAVTAICLDSPYFIIRYKCVETRNLGAPCYADCIEVDVSDSNETTQYTATGAQVYYECDTGYELPTNETTTTIKCVAGNLNESAPFCGPVDCGEPSQIANAPNVTAVNTTYQAIVTYVCDIGYNIDIETRICQANKTWSDEPICTIVDCGIPPDISDADTPTYTLTTYNSTADYTCDTGYETVISTAICQDNGNWSTDPLCTLIDCGNPPNITDAELPGYSSTTFTSTAGYTCDTGYETVISTITCEASGMWTNEPNCTIIDCESPSPIANADPPNAPSTVYNDTAIYTCDTGYTIDFDTRICESNGNWSMAPTCTIVDCGNPPSIADAEVPAYSSTTFNSTADYTCDTGYEAVTSTITCEESGMWTNEPNCTIVDCESPSLIANADPPNAPSTVYNDSAIYTCDTGYTIDFDSRICESNGNWSVAPTCTIVDCESPSLIANADPPNAPSTVYNDTAIYTCDTGYTIDFDTRICESNGNWSMAPTCTIVDCGNPPSIADAEVPAYSSTTFNSTADYTCDTGYETVTSTITCEESEMWTNEPNCTIVDCESPSLIANADPPNAPSTIYNDSAFYTCDTGYTIDFDSRICESNGNWSVAPTCTIVDCGNPPNITDAEVPAYSSTTFNSSAEYTCDTGYKTVTSTITCEASGMWTNELNCTIVDCGNPPNIANAEIPVYSSTTFNSSAEYTCDTGYETVTPTLTCEASGMWTNESNCTLVDCESPSLIANADPPNAPSTVYNDTAIYTCDTGYTIDFDTRFCESNGNWSIAPTCTIVDCGNPPNIADAEVPAYSSTTFNSTADYTCDTGYEAVTSTITCEASGMWTNEPNCTIVDCGNPPNITDAEFPAYSSTTFNSTAEYTCDTGYETVTSTTTCEASGLWTNEPSCTIIDCGNPPNIIDAEVPAYSSTTFNSTADYTCDTGYETVISTITCEASGMWTNEPNCTIVDCGNPPNITDAELPGYSSTTFNSTADYTCDTGYEAVTSTITCEASGMWTNEPNCTIVDCGIPSAVANAQNPPAPSTTYNEKAVYVCDTGYNIDFATRTCQENGNWTVAPTCTIVDCGLPSSVDNAPPASTSSTTYNETAVYSCNTGYNIDFTTRTCEENGNWTAEPTCTIVDCGNPPNITNAEFPAYSSTTFNSSADYICDTGYETVISTITCEENGNWTYGPECTIVDCGVPTTVLNGPTPTYDSTTYESVANYTCNTGYEIDFSTRNCLATGIWSTEPTCTGVDCGNLPEIQNGEVDVAGTGYLSLATYSCDPHYVLQGEDTRQCKADGSWSPEEPNCKEQRIFVNTSPGTMILDRRRRVQMVITTTLDCDNFSSVDSLLELLELLNSPLANLIQRILRAYQKLANSVVLVIGVRCNSPLSIAIDIVVGDNTTFNDTLLDDLNAFLNTSLLNETLELTDANGTMFTIEFDEVDTTFNEVECDAGYFTVEIDCEKCPKGTYQPVDIRELCRPCPNGTTTYTSGTVGIEATVCVSDTIDVDCGSEPLAISNGQLSNNGTGFGAVITYTCNEGYTLNGSSSLTCTEDGVWSGTAPVCQVVMCDVLSDILNGQVDSPETDFSSVATYSCNAGFVLRGDDTRNCQANGTWSSDEPTCEDVDCGMLTDITNGMVEVAGTVYSSEATYSCDPAYVLQGASTRQCQADGAWAPEEPQCADRQRRIHLVVTTTLDCDNFSANSFIDLLELVNNPLANLLLRLIQALASLRNAVVFVIGIRCNSPLGFTVDLVIGDDVALNDTILNELNALLNSSLLDETLELTDSNGDPLTIEFTEVDSTFSEELCEAGYFTTESGTCEKCAKGTYQPVDIRELCRPCPNDTTTYTSGTVGIEATVCVSDTIDIDCGSEPLEISNGKLNNTGTGFGAVITYTCDVGYTLNGSPSLTCTESGDWSGTAPVCQVVDCEALPEISNGNVEYTSTEYSSEATYSCIATFVLDGASTRTCEADGSWSPEEPECKAAGCGNPPALDNGNVDFTSTEFSSEATFTCDSGYTLQGESTRVCQNDTTWSNNQPVCAEIIQVRQLVVLQTSLDCDDYTVDSLQSLFEAAETPIQQTIEAVLTEITALIAEDVIVIGTRCNSPVQILAEITVDGTDDEATLVAAVQGAIDDLVNEMVPVTVDGNTVDLRFIEVDTSANTPLECKAGYFTDIDGLSCEPCAKGTYQPTGTSELCWPCPTGSTTSGTATSGVEADVCKTESSNSTALTLGLSVGLPLGFLLILSLLLATCYLVRRKKYPDYEDSEITGSDLERRIYNNNKAQRWNPEYWFQNPYSSWGQYRW